MRSHRWQNESQRLNIGKVSLEGGGGGGGGGGENKREHSPSYLSSSLAHSQRVRKRERKSMPSLADRGVRGRLDWCSPEKQNVVETLLDVDFGDVEIRQISSLIVYQLFSFHRVCVCACVCACTCVSLPRESTTMVVEAAE